MSPSDLPWWAWMLSAVVAFGAMVLASRAVELYEWDAGFFWKTVRIFAGLFALGTGLIGIIRFVKWAWS